MTVDRSSVRSSGSEPRPRAVERAWSTIVLVMAATCVAQAFGRFTWGAVLPDARDDLLNGSNTMAGFLGTLNVTAYLLGTLAVSWAASKVTLVQLMRIGLTVSTCGLGLASFAQAGPVLGVALVTMGFGGAMIWIPAPAISVRSLPPHRSGLAVGLVGSGIGVGLVFVGQTTAYLDRHSDSTDVWRTMYRIEFAIAILVLIGTFTFLRSSGDRPSGAGGFGGIQALRTVRGWIPATVAYAAFGFAYILVLGFLVARLEDDSGFSSGEAAAMFSILGFATVLGGLSLGRLSDQIGRRITLTGSFVVFGLCALLALTGQQPWVAVAAFGIGFTFAGMPALIIAHIVDHTDIGTYGPAFSAATLAFGIAQMISPQVGGTLADLSGSFTWVFMLAAGISFVGAVFSSRLPTFTPAVPSDPSR